MAFNLPVFCWRLQKLAILFCSLLLILLIYYSYHFPPNLWNSSRKKPILNSHTSKTLPIDAINQKLLQNNFVLRKLQVQMHSLQQKFAHLRKNSDPVKRLQKSNEWRYFTVKYQNEANRKRILVTGGAGFVGSHLVDRLMLEGHEVVALDNYFTGRKRNVEHWIGHPNFELIHHDVVNSYLIEVDEIYHLASPASPTHYMYNPVKTIKTNTIGTINMLGLARRLKARILLASTSEVYGNPEVHPQPENYWGHVNTVGPRSCYDEGKRVAETLMVAYHIQEKVDIRIARIFNTFGPRMHMNDGRVVSNFILQALRGQPMTIYGNGNQTRSFQYVDDLVTGLIKLMESNCTDPVNIGNPEERTINEFAELISSLIGSNSTIVHEPEHQDDPKQRKPDISRANEKLNWKPIVSMRDGLIKTIDYFRKELEYDRMMLKEDYRNDQRNGKSKSFAEKGIDDFPFSFDKDVS